MRDSDRIVRPAEASPCARPALCAAALLSLLAGCAARESGAPLHGAAEATLQQARASPDPMSDRLALWLRAQIPGAASASEIDAFLRADPAWPSAGVLRLRLQQALAVEPDDAVAAALCRSRPPDMVASLLRCAVALAAPQAAASLLPPGVAPAQAAALPPAAAGLPPEIREDATRAWSTGLDDPLDEAEFLRVFGSVPDAASQWQRFDRQEIAGALAAARRQVPRLAPDQRPPAIARIALHAGDEGADGLAAALHPPAARDPALLFDLARWLRRHNRDDEALALWRGEAGLAESVVSPERKDAFWNERAALARDLLDAHRDRDALSLARDPWATSATARLESAFLSGWIELRRLGEPRPAAADFTSLTRDSRSAITNSRGYYWLGRALLAQGQGTPGQAALRQAALWPTTFYGQQAQRLLAPGDPLALDSSIRHAGDPAWSQDEAIRYAGQPFAHAASLLAGWGDPHDAGLFLLRLDESIDADAPGAPTLHSLGAAFADRLGLPDVAVAIARSAGRHGLVLARAGWPTPFTPPGEPPLPPGLALAVMRQESAFDPRITSPAGAHGLMQLMPATARTLVRGEPQPPGAAGGPRRADLPSLFDPETNMTLGTRYLGQLLELFSGNQPLAIAAYNAGPARVRQWLLQNPAPNDAESTIDWIEGIPFNETRNYVERVLESETVYRVRLSGPGALAQAGPDRPGAYGLP